MEARLWARDDRAGIAEAPSLGRLNLAIVLGTLLDRQHPIERHPGRPSRSMRCTPVSTVVMVPS